MILRIFPPRKTEVLIFDFFGSQYLSEVFKPRQTGVLFVRGEEYNLSIIFLAILNFYKLTRLKGLRLLYYFCYIEYVKPRLVATFIDNNEEFLFLSTCIESRTVIVQNGFRDLASAPFLLRKSFRAEYKVNYMIMFGEEIAKEYSKVIKGKSLCIGSLKNNLFPRVAPLKKQEKVLSFISTYRECRDGIDDKEHINTIEDGGALHGNHYYAEVLILNFLNDWCSRNGHTLQIIGCVNHLHLRERANRERKIYQAILPTGNYAFVSKESDFSSYRILDESDLVVFIDSSLGYEAFARGCKVAALTIRDKCGVIGRVGTRTFGWPLELPVNGPFWTNLDDLQEFQRVVDFVRDCKLPDWNRLVDAYVAPRVMSRLQDAGTLKSIFDVISE